MLSQVYIFYITQGINRRKQEENLIFLVFFNMLCLLAETGF